MKKKKMDDNEITVELPEFDSDEPKGAASALPESKAEPTPEKKPEEELQERFLRLAADFDNYRKRVIKEKADYVRYATENLMKELLPVLDNFERALEHTEKSPDADAIQKGVELTYNQLKSALEKFGLRSETALGKPFDPLVHEAVTYVPTEEHDPMTVMSEIQKAYFLQDRLIRPAMVAVAKEPDEEPDAEPDTQTG